MDMRELKALELAARAKITLTDDGTWSVPSQSGPTAYRVVTWPGAESCACEDFALTGKSCKHILAARLVEEREGRRSAPPIVVDEVPKRPTHPQNWPAYDLAQTQEKHRLQVLLADLCAGIPEPPRPKTGRKPVPIVDRLFAVVFKVYCGLSSRRYTCDMKDANDAGFLSRPVHYSKVCAFLSDPDLTAPLRLLVERSALPLKAVETEFAVDSTGFSVSKFVKWFDEKYGVERSGHHWVKAHICTGVRTNVITAAEFTHRDTHDCPLLPGLVGKTAEHFKIGEVSADKGYLSAENVEAVAALGGTAFIAPKSNTTGNIGGLFERMYHFYSYRRAEFLEHYHKRSNVEATFSAVKRKFGDNVRSRNDDAMVNEVLCKFVCHNLCCVILSQIELGIDADFWPAEQDDEPRDVLPLLRRNG